MEPGFDCVFVRSSFPRRAAPSVHVRLHVVQHVSQRVLDHSSPAHIAHLSVRGKKQTTEDQTTADVSERFVRMWISKRSSHRLVLQVLWRVFEMWPKIDRHLKRDGVEVNLTEGKTNRKQENHQHNPCVTDRAALVEWDGGEVEAFKQVFISNTLAHSVFKEYHLKNRICRLTAANRGRFSEWILFLETCPHPAWARRLQAFLRFVHVVLLLKVQVTLELD